MLGSINFMHWEWTNCPKSWQVKFERAGDDDLTVLDNFLIFDNLIDDIFPVAPFEVNGVTYEKMYYQVDEIYPQLETYVKSYTVA
ncbi:ALP1-like protein isoform X1 [Tanacetum coccineum]